MSADNGIYIGRFPIEEGNSQIEYRVIHEQAIDNINYNPGENHSAAYENPREIVSYFGDTKPMTEQEAVKEAFNIEAEILKSECPIIEYGISTITFQHPLSYYQEHVAEIVYPWDKDEVKVSTEK